MEVQSPSSCKRQPVVLLNVGGDSFRLAMSTIARYPDSLLYKMVQEFPVLVEKGEELYVDRNPKAFPWIQEIYRDGDYKSCIPDMARGFLQKELDFYQLPSYEELCLKTPSKMAVSREAYAEHLMKLILEEINESGLRDFFPWTILIYHRIVDGQLDPNQKIYVSPPMALPAADYIKKRGHSEFDNALQMEGDRCPRQALGERSKLSPYNQNVAFLIWKKGYTFIELLEEQAEKHGMEFEEAKAATFYLSNGKMVYGHFILDYKAC